MIKANWPIWLTTALTIVVCIVGILEGALT